MTDRRVDTISGPPDQTRPKNPWPRLLAFFALVVLVIAGVGYCAVSFATPPPREVSVELTAIEPGLPVFVPVTTFGADDAGRTYGALVTYDGDTSAAYLARQPETLCRLGWDASATSGDDRPGAFADPCGEAHYSFEGEVRDGSAPKDMDEFPTRIENREIVVDIERLNLGECREEGTTACSPPDDTHQISVPRQSLGDDFAVE